MSVALLSQTDASKTDSDVRNVTTEEQVAWWFILRLHDEAGSTSWLVQLIYIIARCLLDRVNGVLAVRC